MHLTLKITHLTLKLTPQEASVLYLAAGPDIREEDGSFRER